ncbi:MAG TPA: aldehyde dehydrogenase family protein [Polyangiaceae bacterium]|nr:aldehyde dehydrogenase family protein [Polyangiaceae bacterium]
MSLFDPFGYRGKRALVVGGATGMGAAAAEVVRDAGAEVVVMDRQKITLKGVTTISIDLAERGSIDAALKECGGKVNALFSCAGVADGTPGIERINFIGHRYMIDRMLADGMLPKGSAIGFISSAAGMGWETQLPLLQEFLKIEDFDAAVAWVKEHKKADYMWSKQAICAYVAQQALPFLKRGVRINAVLPGPTDTPLARANADRWLGFGADYRKEAGVEVSTSVEQARPLVFLCSDAAAAISGITMITDVGYTSSAIAESFPSAKMMVNFLRGVGGGGGGPRPERSKTVATSVKPESRMLIDGKLVPADNGATFDNVNPATEDKIGEVADGSRNDMQRAIAAARRAFDETDWSTNRELRKHCLTQLQRALQAEREELREQLILEAGCPRMTTTRQQLDVPLATALPYPLELMDKFAWETEMPDGKGNSGEPNTRRIWKEGVGVVGAIVPWNFPFEVTINKLAQALATGNTVVLKPAPDTPWNATLLGRLIVEKTDFPPGVVNIVTSSDHLLGEALTLSPQVDMVSFTGSTAVGQRIAEKGAATLKRTFLELGGKSANIVLDDANFDSALMGGLAVCFHAGQGCGIPTRMLVPRVRYKEAAERLVGILKMAPYGDPQRPDVMMGPLISAKQRDRVLGYIDKGVSEGAKLVLGGGRPQQFSKGYYVEPTLFIDVDNRMTIAQEEIFGPVLCLIAFDDDDDAVRIANDSRYGLAGMVNSGSLERAQAVARRIRAGMVAVNGGAPHGADMPFGGYKHSGLGRQNGVAGFEQYLETKSVAWPGPAPGRPNA